MPKREDDIRDEIRRLDDYIFERFVIELLSRDLYPGLIPTSQAHDLGEDARTEESTLFLHQGKWISLASSKESGWSKIKKDCDRCKETKRHIDILVFVTGGNPRTGTIDRWKIDVQKNYGWTLVVHTIDFLAPRANRPEYEELVEEYLGIPPLNDDHIRDIEETVGRITSRNLNQIHVKIRGLNEPISRIEVDEIQKKLITGENVVLTGDAGVGKSGIIFFLAQNGLKTEMATLLLDARRFASFQTYTDLRNYFDFKGPVHLAVRRLSRNKGCRLIIDQLDNIAGLPSANLVLEFIEDILASPPLEKIEIIVVCRNKEKSEQDLLRRLLNANFCEVICRPINQDDVKRTFSVLGIKDYSQGLIDFCANLLNLELVGQILIQEPNFDFSLLTDEVHLWEKFIDIWRDTEGRTLGEEMLRDATNIARLGLNNPDGMFDVVLPYPIPVQRLVSWDIITQLEGRMFRFRHEKFQDFIYAKDAADRWLMPKDILAEIPEHRSRNIFRWVEQIYRYQGSSLRIKFWKEVFNV